MHAVGSGSSAKGAAAGPGGAWDVSFLSAGRMGKTDREMVQRLTDGVHQLIQVESKVEGGQKLEEALGKHSNVLEL